MEARKKVWNFDTLWDEYALAKQQNKAFETDRLRYEKHIKTPLGKKEPSELVPLDLERLRRVQCKPGSPDTETLHGLGGQTGPVRPEARRV